MSNRFMIRDLRFVIILFVFLMSIFMVSAEHDVLVFQGQYYENGRLQEGVFDFEFNVYDANREGNLIYSNSQVIQTGAYGEWYVELEGIGANATDSKKGYYMEIVIDGEIQRPRRRLTQLDFVRKEIPQTIEAETTFNSVINVVNESSFKVSNKTVCLQDGTNCPIFSFNETDPVFVLENRSIWSGINSFIVNIRNDLDRKMNVFNLADYYTKESIDELMNDKVSLPVSIDVGKDTDSWLPIVNSRISFNEKKLDNLLSERFSGLDLGGYASLERMNSELGRIRNEIANSDTRLSEREVDLFVSNNGYLTEYVESDPFWTLEKDFYYDKNEINELLQDKISKPETITISDENVDSWLPYIENMIIFNEDKLDNFVDDKIKIIDFSPYVLKSELSYFSGDYNDLENLPSIPVDTKLTESEVDEFVSDNGYLLSYTETDPSWNLEKENFYSKSEVDLLLDSKVNIPISISVGGEVDPWLPIIENRISFNEDKLEEFLDIRELDLSDYYSKQEIDEKILSIGSGSSSDVDLSNYYTKFEMDEMFSEKTISSGEVVNQDVFFVYSAVISVIPSEWEPLEFNNIIRSDSSYSFGKGDKEIGILKTGWYDVNFECTADTSVNSRNSVDWRAVQNGEEILGTRSSSYHRTRGNGRDSASISFVHKFDSGDILNFEAKSTSSDRIFSVSNACRVKILSLSGGSSGEESTEGSLGLSSSQPLVPKLGDMYYNSSLGVLKFYDGVSWKSLRFVEDEIEKVISEESTEIIEEVVYAVGDILEYNDEKYSCKVAGWCNQDAYHPRDSSGTGYWVNAWEKIEEVEPEVVEESPVEKVVESEEVVAEEENVTEIEEAVAEENVSEAVEKSVSDETSGSSQEEVDLEVDVSEEVEIIEEVEEECLEVCEDVCETEEICEDVCEDVEICEEVCEPVGNSGKEKCSEECSTEEECSEECEEVEECSEVCEEVCGIPEQLFDIRMDLEETVLYNSSELEAVVTYESFGRVPTPVDLTFEIFDKGDNLVYSKKGNITVIVQEVGRYRLDDLKLEHGKYKFVFTTLYGVNVRDEFVQSFEIRRTDIFSRVVYWFGDIF